MKTKKFFFPLLASAMLAAMTLTSCANDDNPVNTIPTDPTEEDIYASIEKVNVPTYVSDMTNAYLKEAVDRRFPNRASLDDAQIAVVTPRELGTYGGKLKTLYDKGGLIVVLKPEVIQFRTFASSYGVDNDIPDVDNESDMFLYAFNNQKECYTSYMPVETKYTIKATEYDDETDTWGDSTVSEGSSLTIEDEDYYVNQTNLFIKWVADRYSSKAARTRSSLSEGIDLTSQSISGDASWTYTCENAYDKDHKITGTKRISYAVNVSPFYVYEDNGDKKGDYYKIDARITAHNKEGYDPTWFERDKGADDYIVGIYMTKLKVCFAYEDANKKTLTATFPVGGEPMPQTVNQSTTFSESFTRGVNGSITGGVTGGGVNVVGNVGFVCQWTSSVTQTLNDVETEMFSDGDGAITYNYYTHGPDGDNAIYKIGKTDEDEKWYDWLKGDFSGTNANVPALLRSDMVLNSCWVWHDTSTEDNTEINRRFGLSLKPTYAAWSYRHGKSCKEVEFTPTWPTTNNWIMYRPNRVPFGVLEIKNISDYALGHIKIWRQDDDISKSPYLDLTGMAWRSGENCQQPLELGTYRIRYDFINGNTNEVISSWEIQNVKIHRGTTASEATTSYSSTAGTKI